MIGPFEEVSFAGENRIEHNDPEGVRPRRGVEVRRRPATAHWRGSNGLSGDDPDRTGVNRMTGGGAGKPNGLWIQLLES